VFEADDPRSVDGLPAPVQEDWARAMERRECTGAPLDIVPLGSSGASMRTLLVGAGARDRFGSDIARRIAGIAGMTARQRRAPRVSLLLRPVASSGSQPDRHPLRLLQAFAEGVVLTTVDTGIHKSTPSDTGALDKVTIVVPANVARIDDAQRAVDRGRILGEATNDARTLANEPSNVLTPTVFADRVASRLAGSGVTVDVLDERQISTLNMGLLLGVARGSAEPPRLIAVRYDPPGTSATSSRLGMVGKGITFDTGGISIKPADGMEKMKVDMAGGAAVVSAIHALARLGAGIPAIAVVPCTENMPGGRAIKPGDVLRGASGKTVEVVNTDAEGRLILGDGLWYARELGATHLVDVATLTGACVVALGRSTTGLFGRPDDWVGRVRDAAALAGERAWPMPVFDDYFEQLKSDVADMSNTGGRPAGAVTAALFLKQFTGEVPWAHLDIAGTAWSDEPKPWMAKGATGAAVRTLVELGLSMAG
jgi:leucyl aminopeptidase